MKEIFEPTLSETALPTPAARARVHAGEDSYSSDPMTSVQTRPQSRPRASLGVLPALQSLLQVLIVSLFLITFTVQPIRIPSASMEPTLLIGDFLLLDKASVAPNPGPLLPSAVIERENVVVFHDPIDDPRVHLVKRVVALPGDRLHLVDGRVILNGKPLEEAYAIHRRGSPDLYRDNFPNLRTVDPGVNPAWWIQLRGLVHDGEITVPPGEYFVLGDNRNDSEDSRYWGFVPRAAIVGKPLLVYFSWRDPWHEPEADETRSLSPKVEERSSRGSFARWERTFRVVR